MFKTHCFVIAVAVFASAAPAEPAPELRLFRERNFGGVAMLLSEANSNMNFSPRSAKPGAGGAWMLCPRAFFGGQCIRIDKDTSSLSLPRAFSGTVKSARPVASAAPVEAKKAGEDEKDIPQR